MFSLKYTTYFWYNAPSRPLIMFVKFGLKSNIQISSTLTSLFGKSSIQYCFYINFFIKPSFISVWKGDHLTKHVETYMKNQIKISQKEKPRHFGLYKVFLFMKYHFLSHSLDIFTKMPQHMSNYIVPPFFTPINFRCLDEDWRLTTQKG